MKIFSVMTWLQEVPLEGLPDDRERWRRDPLAHPDLTTMTMRQLADLPFDRCVRIGERSIAGGCA